MDTTVLSLLLGFIIYLFKKMLDKLWINKNFSEKLTGNIKEQIIHDKINELPKIKVGLLTNELPPIVYGGVSTWILNFMKMFKENENIEVIPIFLAHIDNPHHTFFDNYPKIRIINKDSLEKDIKFEMSDIQICVNNLWVANDIVKKIIDLHPNIKMVSVIHSLIKKEHLTNLGSIYTNNFFEQENTFKYSDYVILISKAEEEYYKNFGYDKYKAKTFVIYNSYCPKYDNVETKVDYNNNTLGYLGRHVPRKRPELPIMAMNKNNQLTSVVNMGMKPDNVFWNKLASENSNLETIKFSTDKLKVNKYWDKVGCNCITGVYEPFGYTMCETLDRMVPAIVQDIDGPSEIIDDLKDFVYMYSVDKDYQTDIDNFYQAYQKFMKTPPEVRKENAIKARKALDKFRPENILKQWEKLFCQL